jgi:HlyD family secretion protein
VSVQDEAERAAPEVERALGIGAFGRRARGLALAVGAGALAVAALLWLYLSSGADTKTRYTTEPARRGDLVVTVSATGTLEPTNQVDVGSELSGTIRSVEVDFNDRVKVGQVLARLDTTRLDAQVLQTDAALEAARARVLEAQASEAEAESQLARLERVRELSGGKVPSQQEYAAAQAAAARARATRKSAEAAVTQARATLDAQRTDLGKAAIVSPIAGVVLKRAVEPGQTVAASLQAPILFTLAEDLAHMELRVSVDEADVGQVSEGQEATFSVDAWPDRQFAARVRQVRFGAETVEGVVTYTTVLDVDNSDLLLRPGMTATAEIVVRRAADALLVPNAALRFAPPAEATAPSGGLLRALLPGPRFARRPDAEKSGAQAAPARVWRLERGELAAVELCTGATDGTWTEVVSGGVEPGVELVIDAVAAES